MRVIDLVPGDKVMSAIYVSQARHPIWSSLQLVIWKLPDGSWSHDALSPIQDVGEVVPQTAHQRTNNLYMALIGREAPNGRQSRR